MYPSIDLDAQTESNHDTALTLACAGGHAELVSLLLSRGADIEHRDKKGEECRGTGHTAFDSERLAQIAWHEHKTENK